MENVPAIFQYAKIPSRLKADANTKQRKIPSRRFRRRSRGKFYALTRVSGDTHQTLIDKNSPLRLCVYGSEDDLYLDVITMDKNKKINNSFTRPITNGSLNGLVKSIHNQMGLVIDYSV
ncbi:MAG TPA: hypothetical protein VJ959_16200 [Desulfotignum sp.]|nr:hypothetical protein [Desulfotignum sp.]